MVAMIQQDLSQIGVKVNLVTLDFPSLIERITRTYDYEACLLGLVNTDLDPNSQMNVWLSSAENHQWNPKQSKPATAWEAELDRLMRAQASTTSDKNVKPIGTACSKSSSSSNPSFISSIRMPCPPFLPPSSA